ncbi:hypothetical protein AKO1_005631 [Acrasis kona]|uniref:Cilia- and flagella-associated protein 161 n=1 Tax=Acrasis kona TaxID=1008807 RepID=A0AAW2YIQ8_9EUKA
MDYTPQQLMGHKSYNPRVRIGNWNEDIKLSDTRFNEFLTLRENQALPSHTMKRKFVHHTSEVESSAVAEHGFVQFGDRLMTKSVHNGGLLSVDLDSKLHHVQERYAITCSRTTSPDQQPSPTARSVFIIESVPSKDDVFYTQEGEENILHYGQHFRLKCVPEFHEQLFLRSEKATPSCYSKVSNNQEVSVDNAINFSNEWRVQYLDPKFRFEMEGEPVQANTPFLMTHCASNQNLCTSVQHLVLNDFGKEIEVCCRNMLDSHNAEQNNNHWIFVYNK